MSFLCPQNFCFGGIIKSNCLSVHPSVCLFVRPCQLCLEHISYITLDRYIKLGTNVLLEKAMCRAQDPGLYLKGQGHNHRSKVKKWDILPFWGHLSRTVTQFLFYISVAVGPQVSNLRGLLREAKPVEAHNSCPSQSYVVL